MLLQIVLILVGLAMIVGGANFLTDGAAQIATRFRIPHMFIGLTIVAFGTSAPELTVSILGSLSHQGGIAVGNVIGSNIFNGLAILGLCAILSPIAVERSAYRFDIPVSILAAVVLCVVLMDPQLGDGATSAISRSEAILLIVMGLLYITALIISARRSKALSAQAQTDQQPLEGHSLPTTSTKALWLCVVMVIGGLALLVFGGQLFVNNATMIAKSLGVSDTLIGLTLVSWGTSMPELATSIVAAYKKNADIALGNVVGSNIFNIFFVLGISGTVAPLTGLQFTTLDMLMQLLTAAIIFAVAHFYDTRRITRIEGISMFALFAAYSAFLIIQAI